MGCPEHRYPPEWMLPPGRGFRGLVDHATGQGWTVSKTCEVLGLAERPWWRRGTAPGAGWDWPTPGLALPRVP